MVCRSRAGGLRWWDLQLGRQIRNQYRIFGVNALSRWIQNLPPYRFGGWDDADGYVPQTGRVVAEVDAERAVDVVDDFPRHQEAELHCLHVKVEIAPAQDLLSLRGRFGFRMGAVKILIQGLGKVLWPSVWAERSVSSCLLLAGDDL